MLGVEINYNYICRNLKINVMKKNKEDYLFEEFMEDSWDYVSEMVVSDDFWDKNMEFIREVTFEIYRLQQRYYVNFDAKIAGKTLEIFFSNIVKYGIKPT